MSEGRKQYSQVMLILLALFLGGYGVHQFVVGNRKRGFFYLGTQLAVIVGVIFFYTGLIVSAVNDGFGVGAIISMIIGGLILMVALVMALVVFVFTIIDIVKIAQGTFLTGDGYPAVEGY